MRPKLLSVDSRFDSSLIRGFSETFPQSPLFLLVTFFIFLAYYIFSLLYSCCLNHSKTFVYCSRSRGKREVAV